MRIRRAGLVLAVRDVSEIKRMEWEIFQVEKMTALGRLAASVAHEVRNPLGAIDIQLQLLEEDLERVVKCVKRTPCGAAQYRADRDETARPPCV